MTETPQRLLVREFNFSSQQVRKFLTEFANCGFGDKTDAGRQAAWNRFFRRFGDVCPVFSSAMSHGELLAAWKEPILHHREAWLIQAAAGLKHWTKYAPDKEVRLCKSLAAMFLEGFRLANAMRVCPSERCTAPFFFARNLNQKFCSSLCAGPSIRESKRKWWKDNRAPKPKKKAAAKSKRKRKRGKS